MKDKFGDECKVSAMFCESHDSHMACVDLCASIHGVPVVPGG